MLSPINTGGFDVDVMPHYTPVNPQLLAKYDPAPYLAGFQNAASVGKAMQSLQEQPSQTAANIAGNTLTAKQDTGLSGLDPLMSIAVQKGEVAPVHKVQQQILNPDTGNLETRELTFGNGEDINDPSKAIESSVVGTQKTFDATTLIPGPNGTTLEQTTKVVSNTPGKNPIGPTDLHPNLAKDQPNEYAVSIGSQNKVQQSWKMTGSSQDIVTAKSLREQAKAVELTDPVTAASLNAQADVLEAQVKARTGVLQAQQDQIAGKNATEKEVAQDRLEGVKETNESQEKRVSATNASKERIEQGRENSAVENSWIKQYGLANAQKISNLSASAKAYETMAEKATDDDEKQANMQLALRKRAALGKMIEDGVLNAGNMSSGSTSPTVNPGSSPQQQAPVMKPEDVRAWASANPGKTVTYVGSDGVQRTYTAPASASLPVPATQ